MRDGVRVVIAAGLLVNEMVGEHHQVVAKFLGRLRRLAHRRKIHRAQKHSKFHRSLRFVDHYE